jgi:hypothetical protein
MSDDSLLGIPKELVKVANNLINRVSKGTWTLYEPFHVKRMTKAEGVAQTIAAKAGIEITNLQQRAIARWLHEEEWKQGNLETTIKGSIPDLTADSKPQDIDDDWLMSFLDFAKNVSDKNLQLLWSKILAGKANRPGKFRKDLLQCVYLLEKTDADLFVNLCQFAIDLEVMTILIFDPQPRDLCQQVSRYTQFCI